MSHGKRVEWDEQNLTANAEYQRQHPVTMHITEPKTPFNHEEYDLGLELAEEAEAAEKWDPAVNAKVKEIKEQVTSDVSDRPRAPVSKKGRPMLLAGTDTGELAEEQHHREFNKMRKAVYADEGAMFKKALKHHDDDEEDEESS